MLRILTRPWSEDSSTPISIKSDKPTGRNKRKTNKAGSNKKGQQHNKKGERGGQVLKNLTRLWPGSSSTQSGERDQIKHPTQKDLGAMAKLGGAHVVNDQIKSKQEEEAGSPDSL